MQLDSARPSTWNTKYTLVIHYWEHIGSFILNVVGTWNAQMCMETPHICILLSSAARPIIVTYRLRISASVYLYISRVIALPSVKNSSRVETDVFESRDLGGARRVTSQLVAKTGTMHNNAAGEATKKRLVFGRLLSLSATYVQGSAIDAAGKWRRGRLLETHKRIARTCRPLIALISLLIQRLHKLY